MDKKGGVKGAVVWWAWGPVGASSRCHTPVSTTSPHAAKRFREERLRGELNDLRDDVDAD